MVATDYEAVVEMRISEGPSSPFERTYAVGDVHGRYDLFRRLTNLIACDQAECPPAATQIVLLGNIIDRGPDSASMVRGCMKMTAFTDSFTVLKGNHEDMMAEALSGNLTVYSHWLHFGGRETLLSWGVSPEVAQGPATMDNLVIAAKAVGADVLTWLRNLPLHYQRGQYLFVHAGVRPGIQIGKQDPDDLMWIEDAFLGSAVSHGAIVVHGHSITEGGPVVRPNRIGIDTGAYRTGRLTALGIENGETWSLDTMRDCNTGADNVIFPASDKGELGCSAARDHRGAGGEKLRVASPAFGEQQLDADLSAILGPWDGISPAAPGNALNTDALPVGEHTYTVPLTARIGRPQEAAIPLLSLRAMSRLPSTITATLGLALLSLGALYSREGAPVEQSISPHINANAEHAAARVEPNEIKAYSVANRTVASMKPTQPARVRVVEVPSKHRSKALHSHPFRSFESQEQSASVVTNRVQNLEKTILRPVFRAIIIQTTRPDASPPVERSASPAQLVTFDQTPTATISGKAIDTKRARRESVDAMRSLRRQ